MGDHENIEIHLLSDPSADAENHGLVDIPLYNSGTTKIPADLIARKPNAYKPRTISLGRIHFGKSRVKNYEEKKKQLRQDRFPYRDRHFKELVDSMKGNLSRIRQWYPISDSFQEPKKFAWMMAQDGIFLLQFLREISPISKDEISVNLANIRGLTDPEGFRNLKKNVNRKIQEQLHALTNQEVHEDILKLQNQIPLFVLKMIIRWEENTYEAVRQTMPQQEESEEKKTMLQDIMLQARRGTNQNLEIILRRAWHNLSPFDVKEESLMLHEDTAHILGYVYENILGEGTDHTQYNGEGNQKKTLPTAVDLDNKGVKFAVYSGPLNKIRFDRNTWTFHLPRIEIAERTDAVMRNLVAFELFGCEVPTKPIKCYVELMDQLINKAEDVEVLKNRGIIHHHLGSDQEVADIWNKMREGHGQTGKYGPIDIAIDEVIKFNGSYKIWFSEGVKKFFSKPWLVVSFIAGFIVVITAILQTIFSLLQFYQSLKKSIIFMS